MSQDFAQWFKTQLARRDWNQSDFARKTGISQTTVSTWVRGRSVPDPASCDTIADAFLLGLDDVLTHAGHRPGALRSDEAGEAVTRMVGRVRWNASRRGIMEALVKQWLDEDQRSGRDD